MAYTAPTLQDFQNQFFRDFNFGSDPANNVLDADVYNAFVPASMMINGELWDSQALYTYGYNLLTAHFLVINIRSSSQGLNGQYNWAQAGKSVGAVSENFQIPDRITQNPELMALCKTNYGAQYINLVLPQLTGQIFSVYGRTKP